MLHWAAFLPALGLALASLGFLSPAAPQSSLLRDVPRPPQSKAAVMAGAAAGFVCGSLLLWLRVADDEEDAANAATALALAAFWFLVAVSAWLDGSTRSTLRELGFCAVACASVAELACVDAWGADAAALAAHTAVSLALAAYYGQAAVLALLVALLAPVAAVAALRPSPAATAPAPAAAGGAPPRILIVGAGAVGQVYAQRLQAGGAAVTLFVRPKHAEAVRRGLHLYFFRGFRAPAEHVAWREFEVATTAAEVSAAGGFDQVWLCVSATALAAAGGPWLAALLAAAGDAATVVSLVPGLQTRELVLAHAPAPAAERVVFGRIQVISYECPLEGSAERFDPPGVAYVDPGPMALEGPAAAVGGVADAVLRAGMRVKLVEYQDSTPGKVEGLDAHLLRPLLFLLETHEWRFAPLRTSALTPVWAAAAREAAALGGLRPPRLLLWLLLSPPLLQLATLVAPRLFPFDIAVYLGYHFTKVGDQTQHHVDSLLVSGGGGANLRYLRGMVPDRVRYGSS